MTFLNPLVLFGLIAAAIPLLLHLLNLRKLRTIEFSTLTFLKELQQTKIRRLKLRQILLLIIRTLLVILVILAFARPALKGTWLTSLGGAQAHSTIVLVLDDSFSMSASDEHGELFKQAKDAAGKLIDLFKDGDDVFLLKLSDLPSASIAPATHDFQALRTMINESAVSTVTRPMDEALTMAATLLKTSSNVNKEVYILSDMQRTLFNRVAAQSGAQGLVSATDRTKFFLVPLGAKPATNVAVDSAEVTTTILEKDKPASIYLSVRNFSDLPVNNYVVSAFVGGTRSAQANLSIAPWSSASTTLNVTPKKAGLLKGTIELEHDAIEPDNSRFFTLEIPEHINVALLGSAPSDQQFIRLALAAEPGEGNRSLISVQQIPLQQFSYADLKHTDVIVCQDISQVSASDAQRLKAFVERGGGLVLFPASNTTGAGSQFLLAALSIPTWDGIVATGAQNGISFSSVDFDHPLFSTVFERDQQLSRNRERSLESPSIYKSLKRQPGRQARSIIRLSDGSTFLSENSVGVGRVLFFSVAPTLAWSDFPLKGIFAPLVYRSVLYTAPHEEHAQSARTGSRPTIILRSAGAEMPKEGAAETGNRFHLLSPDGVEELVQAKAQLVGNVQAALSFALPQLNKPGIYELKNGTTVSALVPANIDPLESDTRRISQEDLQKFLERMKIPPASVREIQPGDHLQASILESRFGVELWRYCVAGALLLALLEMLLARDSSKGLPQTAS